MQLPVNALTDMGSAAMLAEHERVANLYLHNAAMGERRVTIHLLFVAGGGTLLLSLPQLMGLRPEPSSGFFPIIQQLLFPAAMIVVLIAIEGVLTFRRIIERRIRATEYLRAINRINRFFADREPSLSRYLPWPTFDDVPGFGGRTLGIGDLRDVVAVLNSVYAGILGADATLFLLGVIHSPVKGGDLAPVAAVLAGFAVGGCSWWSHACYERRIVHHAEREALVKNRVQFPSRESGRVNPTGGADG